MCDQLPPKANPVRPETQPEPGWLLAFIAALVVVATIGGVR